MERYLLEDLISDKRESIIHFYANDILQEVDKKGYPVYVVRAQLLPGNDDIYIVVNSKDLGKYLLSKKVKDIYVTFYQGYIKEVTENDFIMKYTLDPLGKKSEESQAGNISEDEAISGLDGLMVKPSVRRREGKEVKYVFTKVIRDKGTQVVWFKDLYHSSFLDKLGDRLYECIIALDPDNDAKVVMTEDTFKSIKSILKSGEGFVRVNNTWKDGKVVRSYSVANADDFMKFISTLDSIGIRDAIKTKINMGITKQLKHIVFTVDELKYLKNLFSTVGE